MPLGLQQLARPIHGLEAILVSMTVDDIMFDAWSRDGSISTDEYAAGYLGLFVRTRKEVLDGLGIARGPVRASIETDDRILLFRHIQNEYLLMFVFHANVTFGLARVHADELQQRILQKITGPSEINRPSFAPPIPPSSSNDSRLASQQTTTPPTQEDHAFQLPMPDDLDRVEPQQTPEALLFDPAQKDAHPTEDADADVAFSIGNIEPAHFEADAVPHHPLNVRPLSHEDDRPPQTEETTMSTYDPILHQPETHMASTAQAVQTHTTLQKQSVQLDDAIIGRLRMTYEGGIADTTPVDTPTERQHATDPARTPIDQAARMAYEGGRLDPNSVDTPTERPIAPASHGTPINQALRMTYEGGRPPQHRVDTATENHSSVPPQASAPKQSMANEGGPVPQQPVDTPTERHTGPRSSAHDIVASVRAQDEPASDPQRIKNVIDYVMQHVANPNTAQARLAIHARVPLELVRAPQRLSDQQGLQLEEAAKIMLGVETLPV